MKSYSISSELSLVFSKKIGIPASFAIFEYCSPLSGVQINTPIASTPLLTRSSKLANCFAPSQPASITCTSTPFVSAANSKFSTL